MNRECLYTKNENIVARQIHDTYFLINIADNYAHDKCILYQVNEIGYFIWSNIHGKETSGKLANLIKLKINDDIEYNTILCDVIEFLMVLKKRGFIIDNESN